MRLEIKKLTKYLVNDYIDFFDTTPHDSGKNEDKCYCVGWCSRDHRNDNIDYSTADKRREIAKDYIEKEFITGYLAYYNNKVVGWCNANEKEKCMYCGGWNYVLPNVYVDKSKIKCIFCFVISPDMQRQGIATEITKRVIEDAIKDGYDYVESYPYKEFNSVRYDFMGPVHMYEKLGFEIYATLNSDKVIVRKRLK